MRSQLNPNQAAMNLHCQQERPRKSQFVVKISEDLHPGARKSQKPSRNRRRFARFAISVQAYSSRNLRKSPRSGGFHKGTAMTFLGARTEHPARMVLSIHHGVSRHLAKALAQLLASFSPLPRADEPLDLFPQPLSSLITAICAMASAHMGNAKG
jgi:hypothetical protein